MEYRELLTVAGDFAIAILLGALVGIEREKRKTEEQETDHIAGLRTFILLALLGAAAGWLSREASAPWILVASLLIVGAFVVVGYRVTARPPDAAGLTTEVAAIVVFLLGAMVMLGNQELASGSASSLPPCSPTSSRCTASWPSSAGTMSMPGCGS